MTHDHAQSEPASPGGNQHDARISGAQLAVLLVADDLTGVCDSALAFVKAGLSAFVQTDARACAGLQQCAVWAISAESRNLQPDEAAPRMAALSLPQVGPGTLLFHKVDSAGRGNPGEELLALASRWQCEAVVYAPAYPSAGRTVQAGQLRVRDFAGQDRALNLLDKIPHTGRAHCARIDAESVDGRRQQIQNALSAGQSILLCDAVTQADLERTVSAAQALPQRLLWCGSAGLAEAVARSLQAREVNRMEQPAAARTLVISGTDHAVTRAQMRALAGGLQPGHAPLECLQKSIAVELDWSKTSAETIYTLWRQQAAAKPALLLTGGDTASFVLRVLGATGLRLGGEVEAGVPWGVIVDGAAAGSMVMTKSGGFGGEQTLIRAVEFARQGEA